MDADSEAPFSATHDVTRWNGKHTDGPQSAFERRGGMLVLKAGAQIDRSSLLNERIQFGKHKGNRWLEVPDSYLNWLVENGTGKWKKTGDTARAVLAEKGKCKVN